MIMYTSNGTGSYGLWMILFYSDWSKLYKDALPSSVALLALGCSAEGPHPPTLSGEVSLKAYLKHFDLVKISNITIAWSLLVESLSQKQDWLTYLGWWSFRKTLKKLKTTNDKFESYFIQNLCNFEIFVKSVKLIL